MLESAANAPSLFDRLSLFFLSAARSARSFLASAGLGNGSLRSVSAAIFSGLCGGVVWGGDVLSALCGIRVLSDRAVMALRRGEGMAHPLTAPGAI